jgi:multicomponent Na+:H+ antiporter subunit G
MSHFLDIAGFLCLIGGTSFLLFGAIGLIRMPDLYNRIQAGTKTTTLGTLLVLLGAILIQPEWWFKFLLIGVFMLFTNPLSSQVLANAAHRNGVKTASETSVDQLAEDRYNDERGKQS